MRFIDNVEHPNGIVLDLHARIVRGEREQQQEEWCHEIHSIPELNYNSQIAVEIFGAPITTLPGGHKREFELSKTEVSIGRAATRNIAPGAGLSPGDIFAVGPRGVRLKIEFTR